jgi:excisionase family DNA binding protein
MLLLTRVGRGQPMRPTMDTTKQAFAVREFCARYGICRQTFYDEVKRGRIKAKKLGKKTVILRSDAEKWAASLPALNLAVAARS